MVKLAGLDPRCGIYRIDVPSAEKLVEDPGAKNRPLSLSRVNRYGDRLRSGKWRMTGEAILLSLEGKLLDGEHRLRAVIASGKELETVVLWGNFNFGPMGQGAHRTAADVLALGNGDNSNLISLAALAGMCIKHDRAMKREASPHSRTGNLADNWMDIDNSEITAWVKKHPRANILLLEVSRLVGRDRPVVAKSILGAAWFLVERTTSEEVGAEWFTPLITGAGLKGGDIRLLLRRALTNAGLQGVRIKSLTGLQWVAKAWSQRQASGKQVFSVRAGEQFHFIR